MIRQESALEIQIPAYAKVNLHLEVLNRRGDGYHEILSVMASVGLCDLLKLEEIRVHEESKTPVSVSIVNAGGRESSITDSIPINDNLIVKATVRYLQALGMTGTVVYSLEKNIPAGAGMGGGSTDAAAALTLMNNHVRPLGAVELAALGAQLGADVPFCLRGGMALCRGIGDIIEPLDVRLPHWIIIVNDGTHVNTAGAYRSLNRGDQGPDSRDIETRAGIIRAFLAEGVLDTAGQLLVNDFEEPVFKDHPGIALIKEDLYRRGACYATMTGSGSTVIGLFSDEGRAYDSAAAITGNYRTVIVTRFIA